MNTATERRRGSRAKARERSPRRNAAHHLLRGKSAKRRQRRKQRADFEEAARSAALIGAGNRIAATVDDRLAELLGGKVFHVEQGTVV